MSTTETSWATVAVTCVVFSLLAAIFIGMGSHPLLGMLQAGVLVSLGHCVPAAVAAKRTKSFRPALIPLLGLLCSAGLWLTLSALGLLIGEADRLRF